MQNVSFPQIVDQLYKTFSNEAEASQYNNTQSGAQYMGLCGWAGTMSPLNRAAFVDTFGQDVTDRAEAEARARVAEYRAAYEASEYHRHNCEAYAADPDQVPAVGSFVFACTDWLKCEGGPMDPLKNHVNDWGSLRPELVEIAAVVEVEPAEFLSAETAHRIAREHQNHGGSRYNEADPLRLDGQPYAWTVGVLVVCRAYGDGEKSQTPARWYVVDSEGFSWARYILMPQRFASMYAEEIADLRAQRAAVEAQKEAEEQAAKAARLAEYRARCARWEGAGLVDVRPLIEAEAEANKAHGWRSTEAKSAARKLAAARRRNILTMCQAAAPGVKFSVKKWYGWGGSYEVSWVDGPTEAELKAAADLDLLEEGRDTFDGMTDCAGHSRAEFVDFAAQYLGVFGEINTSRETSPEYRAEIIARIREAVPGLPEDDRAPVDESTAWTIADTFTPDTLHRYDVAEYAQRWGLSDAAALIARNTSRPTTNEAPTDPTPDNGGTGAAYGDSEKSQNQEAPDGLTLEEIPGGVAVVGDSRATYKARCDIKAHGARWNKAAQRWEATDPEAVESLRQWLTPAPAADATPTEEAAPAAYGDCEKSQPQSEADRARVRLEEIRASIEAEAVSYTEIAELQNELRPYIAPEDLDLLQWAEGGEEPQELPAPPAAVVYDPAQPVERAEFHTVDAEGRPYGDSQKSQISIKPGEIYKVAAADRVIVILDVEDEKVREADIFKGKWSNQVTSSDRRLFIECVESGKIIKADASALPAEVKSVREWGRELSDHIVSGLEAGARRIKEAYESMTREERQEAADRLGVKAPATPVDMIYLAVAHRWNRLNGRYRNCAAIEWVVEAEHEDDAFRMAAGAYALIFSEYVRKIAANNPHRQKVA